MIKRALLTMVVLSSAVGCGPPAEPAVPLDLTGDGPSCAKVKPSAGSVVSAIIEDYGHSTCLTQNNRHVMAAHDVVAHCSSHPKDEYDKVAALYVRDALSRCQW